MRELKFRAWDKKKKYWLKNDCVFVKSNGEVFVCQEGEKFITCEWRMNPDIVLMQFTGLKDKNGKEIYEGDIIKIVFNDGENYEIGEVVFTGGYHVDGSLLDDTQEIIGNIYKNPDLLEAK